MRRRGSHILLICAAAALLSACVGGSLAPRKTAIKPTARPVAAAPAPKKEPSAQSKALAEYYQRVEADLLAQGLLRTDGGGPDTPFDDTTLARNFERIALAEEYVRGAGLQPASGALGQIKKWTGPVRVGAVYGASVDPSVRRADNAQLARFTNRLARVTGYPITFGAGPANFHVLVMGQDDREQLRATLKRIAPGMEPSNVAVFTNLPRSIHCLVVAFSDSLTGNNYRQAVALVRAEHPDLMRRACYHEELAQGLGLANDDQNARPSIFNDDEEFALLTTHDEMLLKILYDPRLLPGMTAEQVRPLVAEKAMQLAGQAGAI